MQPLKIVWTLRTPVVRKGDHPLMLDAILANCAVRLDHRENGFGDDPWSAQNTLPLASTQGVWQASMLLPEYQSERLVTIMRRAYEMDVFARAREPDLKGFSIIVNGEVVLDVPEALQGRGYLCRTGKNEFDMASGEYRGFLLHVGYRWVKSMTAYCVGDKQQIEVLLRECHHLGPLGRNGFGSVASCKIEDCPEAADLWRLRPVPAGLELDGFRYAKAHQPLSPPYWDRLRRQEVLVPVVSPTVSPEFFERCSDAEKALSARKQQVSENTGGSGKRKTRAAKQDGERPAKKASTRKRQQKTPENSQLQFD